MSLYSADAGTLSAAITVAAGGNIAIGGWMRCPPNTKQGGTRAWMFRQEGATNGFARLGLANADGSGSPPKMIYEMATSAGSAASLSFSVADIADGRWHHVLVTDSGGNLLVWVDGIRRTSGNTFRTVGYSGTVTTSVGNNDTGYGVFYSDIQAFARVPSRSEIAALIDGVDLRPSGRYCIGSAIGGQDLSGRGNHLSTISTLSGTFCGADDPAWMRLGMRRSRYIHRIATRFVPQTGGQPTMRRWGGIPNMRTTRPSLGAGWR